MNYSAALATLNSGADYERDQSQMAADLHGGSLTLAPLRTLLAALGNPHQRPGAIHIAGTKGKGSIGALLAASLTQAGETVGWYSSPACHSPRERIQINGQPITPDELIAGVQAMQPHVAGIAGLTTFDRYTALAFYHFAQAKCTYTVIETGLGGQHDSTNVLINPRLTMITPISLDHTAILGNTITDIAQHKAGILKPGVPVILAPQSPPAEKIIAGVAKNLHAPLIHTNQYTLAGRHTPPSTGQQTLIISGVGGPWRIRISLAGVHQAQNLLSVVAALKTLGQPVPHTLTAVQLPGRTERLTLPTGQTVILDMAHNPAAAAALRNTLSEQYPRQRFPLIVAAPADKDLPGLLAQLTPIASEIIFTQADHPRAARPQALSAALAEQAPGFPALILSTVAAALHHTLDLTPSHPQNTDSHNPNTPSVIVTGSLHTVAEARLTLNRDFGAALLIHQDPTE